MKIQNVKDLAVIGAGAVGTGISLTAANTVVAITAGSLTCVLITLKFIFLVKDRHEKKHNHRKRSNLLSVLD